MEKIGWFAIGFAILILIIIIVIIVIIFDRGIGPFSPTGSTGPFGPSGATGSPCGNNTPFDQLCLMNGTMIALTNNQTGGPLGICQGDVLNAPNNWCVDVGVLNFCSTSPNISDSTTWQVLRSTNNQFFALLNTTTGQYLSADQFWTSCVPCTFGFGCNNPVSTFPTNLDPDNPGEDPGSWFRLNIVNLTSFMIQISPSSGVGFVGSDSTQINSNSCSNMVVANYNQANLATIWFLSYVV